MMSMNRCLVTGASGFVGRFLCTVLFVFNGEMYNLQLCGTN